MAWLHGVSLTLLLMVTLSSADGNSLRNERTRLEIILVHWDMSNEDGSYLKLKNSPMSVYSYAVNISGVLDGVTSPSYSNNSVDINHDKYGVGVLHFQWPSNASRSITISVQDMGHEGHPEADFLAVSVLLHTDPQPDQKGLYYPRDWNANMSMIKLEHGWSPVWDNSDKIWLVDESNPQQVQVLDISDTSSTLYCFVCDHGLSTALLDYTLTLTTDAKNYTLNLHNRMPTDGIIRIAYNETISGTKTYSLRLNMDGSNATTGNVADLPQKKSTTYNNVFDSGPSWNNVYMNEVHFPKLNGTKKDDVEYWIEIIGPRLTNMSNYCLSMSSQVIGRSWSANTACLRPEDQAAISSKGYFSWTISGGASQVQRYLLLPNIIHSINLYREDTVAYTLLDEFKFRLVDEGKSSCQGYMDSQYCNTEPAPKQTFCNSLCLNTQALLRDSGKGVSRCGILKDRYTFDSAVQMSVWYIQRTTKKGFNICSKPKAYLKTISIGTDSNILISVKDSQLNNNAVSRSQDHLPNMGLMLMVWTYTVRKPYYSVPLSGADLTYINSSVSSTYPLDNVNINVTRRGKVSISDGNMTATGGWLIDSSSVFAIALVQYYTFLPQFNISAQAGQIVDAVVYSKRLPFSYELVTTFMDMSKKNDQGQLIFDRTIDPVFTNTDGTTRRMASWMGVGQTGDLYDLDKAYLTMQVQKHLRIERVGNDLDPYVLIKLVDVPDKYKRLYSGGLSLDRLCLVISSPPARGLWAALAVLPLNSETLQLDESKKLNLTDFRGQKFKFKVHSTEHYIMLFRDNNSTQLCNRQFELFNNPMNGVFPSDAEGLIIDAVKVAYSEGVSDNTLILNDAVEAARCNSKKPFFNAAFSLVGLGRKCPAPEHLYIYKLCQGRVGIASDAEKFLPIATDYLYLYQLNDANKIVNLTRLNDYSALSWRYSLIPAPNIILKTEDVTSFGLGWFPVTPPILNETIVTNHTLSVLIVSPNATGMADRAQNRLRNIIETTVNPGLATRDVAVFKPSPMDHRHCLVGRDRSSPMTDILEYEVPVAGEVTSDDNFSYSTDYQNVLINEMNIDTRGFYDKGEFVELIGPPGFNHTTGLSLAIIYVDGSGHPAYKYIIPVNNRSKMFNVDGFFLFERNTTSNVALPSNNDMPMMRILPNAYGCVALLWGADLVPSIANREPVLPEHLKLPHLFLDVIVYAKNEIVSHSLNVKTLMNAFGDIKGDVAIETLGIVNSNETISRCFCKESWNMDCFEMSFNETRKKKNSCPTAFRKSMNICLKKDEMGPKDTGMSVIRDYLEGFMANGDMCRNASCSFSKYQAVDFTSCVPENIETENIEMWHFDVGFPSMLHYNTLAHLITVENLLDDDALLIVQCGDATCPKKKPSSSAHIPGKHPGVADSALIGGIIGGLVVVIVIVVIIVLLVRKRQKRLRNLSARFEPNTEEEDDETFLPDGRISFSNAWYSAGNGSSNGDTSKAEYHKLSHSTEPETR